MEAAEGRFTSCLSLSVNSVGEKGHKVADITVSGCQIRGCSLPWKMHSDC